MEDNEDEVEVVVKVELAVAKLKKIWQQLNIVIVVLLTVEARVADGVPAFPVLVI